MDLFLIGLHRVEDYPELSLKRAKKGCRLWNAAEIMSYIPIIGMVAGVFHLIVGITGTRLEDKSFSFSASEIAKGIILIVTFGFAGPFYAIISISVSVKREYDR